MTLKPFRSPLTKHRHSFYLYFSLIHVVILLRAELSSAQSHMRPTLEAMTLVKQQIQQQQQQHQNQQLIQHQQQSQLDHHPVQNQRSEVQVLVNDRNKQESATPPTPPIMTQLPAQDAVEKQGEHEQLAANATSERQLQTMINRIRSDITNLVHPNATSALSSTPTSATVLKSPSDFQDINASSDAKAAQLSARGAQDEDQDGIEADDDDDDDDDDDEADDGDEQDDDDEQESKQLALAVDPKDPHTRIVRDLFGNSIKLSDGNSTVTIVPGPSNARDFGWLGIKALLLAPLIGLTIKSALVKGFIWSIGMYLLHLLIPGLLTTLGLGSGLVGFARQLRPDYAQLILANLASLPENLHSTLPPSVQKLTQQYKQVFQPVIETIQSIPEGPCRFRAVCETASHLIQHTQFMSNSLQRLSATVYLNFGTDYSKAWLDGIVSSDCSLKYATCSNSPLSQVVARLAETVRPVNF